MPALSVRLLGNLALEGEGELVGAAEFPGRQGRLAFTYLALRRQAVTRDELAEIVWGEHLSRSWERDLSAIVSKLRALLTRVGLDGSASIPGAMGCYELLLPAGTFVDVDAAHAFLEDAEAALRARDEARAHAAAASAANLAMRPLLPNEDAEWLERYRGRLQATLVRALDIEVDVLRRRGDHHEALRLAATAVDTAPFRETGYVSLMRVHLAAGNRAEALRTYESCRKLLAEELGVPPAPETEAVYREALAVEPDISRAAIDLPLPSVLAAIADPETFVGRGDSFAELRHALARAREGRLRLVMVAGEAGIGKTRLVAEFAAAVAGAGRAGVVAGRCDREGIVPYQPFVEILREVVSRVPAERLHHGAADGVADLLALVPELGDRLGIEASEQPEGETARHRLFEAVTRLLFDLSRSRPLVLVVEDLQWADTPTVLLLRHLLRSPAAGALLVVGTVRESELDQEHPLGDTLVDLRRDDRVVRLTLRGLDAEEVRELLRPPLPTTSTRLLANALHGTTDGNPFFVCQLLDNLVETGEVVLLDGRWIPRGRIDHLVIPDDVKAVIGRRLSRLPDETRRTVTAAAIIGRTFDLDVLRVLTEDDEDALLERLEEALRAGVVEEVAGAVDRYTFAHALVREALVETLSTSRRVRMHAQVAAAIERLHTHDLDAQVTLLAYHWLEAAGRGDATKAVDYARRAARQALDQRAYEEAAAWLGRAVGLAADRDGGRQRLALQLDLGDARNRAGELEDARVSYASAAELASTLGDPAGLARAALGYTQQPTSSLAGSYDTRGLGLLEAALTSLPDDDAPIRAAVLARLARESYWSPDQSDAVALARDALSMARRTGDPIAVADALAVQIECSPLQPEQQLTSATELLEIAATTRRAEDELLGRLARMQAMRSLADFDALADESAAYAALAGDLRMPAFLWYSALWDATSAYLAGRLEEAEQLSRVAFDTGSEPHGATAGLHFFGQRLQLRYEQDRIGEMFAIIEPYVAGGETTTPILRTLVSWMYAQAGRLEEARASVGEFATFDVADVPENYNWLLTMVLRAELAFRLHDTRQAELLLDVLAPRAHHVASSGCASVCWGPAARYTGQLATLLERYDEAEPHFTLALDRCAAMRSPLWRAHVQHDFATMLTARNAPGDADRAAELGDAARRTAEELGLTLLAQRIGQLGGSMTRPAADDRRPTGLPSSDR